MPSPQPAPSVGAAAESTSPTTRHGIDRRSIADAVPLAMVLGMGVVLAALEGGFADNPLYVAALFTLGALVVLSLARATPDLSSVAPSLRVASIALGGFVLWSYASIGWADVRGEALRGANRTLLYALVFAVVVLSPLTARAAVPILALFAVAVAVLVFVTAYRLSEAVDPLAFVIGNRLSAPIGYPNGTAALLMLSAWLSFGLGTRRWVAVAWRAVALAAAAALVLLALLSQSRGSVFTTPAVVLAFALLVPGRARAILTAAVGGAIVGIAAPHVLEVFRSDDPAELAVRVGSALRYVAAAAVLTGVVGAVFALLDRRIVVPGRAGRIGTAALLGCVVLVGLVGTMQLNPVTRADDWWQDFKSSTTVESDDSHFGGLGSNRYDFWRIGLSQFADHPVRGIGVDNFLVPYLKERRSPEEPLYPHSLAVDLLSQTGLVGTGLFAAFLGAVGWAVVRRPAGPERELAGVVAVAALALLLHSAVDWLWEIPVLGVVGTALLALPFALRSAPPARPSGAPVRTPVGVRVAFGVGCVLAALAFLGPWLSVRYTDHATTTWRVSTADALAQLDRARALNVLSEEPDLIAATIAIQVDDLPLARTRLEQAVDRNESNWYAQLQLGAVAAAGGDMGVARQALRRALALNPDEPLVCLSSRRLAEGRPLTPREVERALENEAVPRRTCNELGTGV